jgi:glycosyltransferase involved in cell wall biosynthesis
VDASRTLGIIGGATPQDRTRYQRLIAARGLSERIKLLGFIQDNDTVRAWIARASCYVSPRRQSGDLGALEALAMGVPVIGYTIAALNLSLGNQFIRVPVGNTARFTEMIVGVFSGMVKGPRKRTMPTWKDIARRFVEILQKGYEPHRLRRYSHI